MNKVSTVFSFFRILQIQVFKSYLVPDLEFNNFSFWFYIDLRISKLC